MTDVIESKWTSSFRAVLLTLGQHGRSNLSRPSLTRAEPRGRRLGGGGGGGGRERDMRNVSDNKRKNPVSLKFGSESKLPERWCGLAKFENETINQFESRFLIGLCCCCVLVEVKVAFYSV